jgi:acetyl-CoA carboxylase beta subunit
MSEFQSFLERTTPRCLRCKVILFAAEVRNKVNFCPECFDIVCQHFEEGF